MSRKDLVNIYNIHTSDEQMNFLLANLEDLKIDINYSLKFVFVTKANIFLLICGEYTYTNIHIRILNINN